MQVEAIRFFGTDEAVVYLPPEPIADRLYEIDEQDWRWLLRFRLRHSGIAGSGQTYYLFRDDDLRAAVPELFE